MKGSILNYAIFILIVITSYNFTGVFRYAEEAEEPVKEIVEPVKEAAEPIKEIVESVVT